MITTSERLAVPRLWAVRDLVHARDLTDHAQCPASAHGLVTERILAGRLRPPWALRLSQPGEFVAGGSPAVMGSVTDRWWIALAHW